MVEISTDYDKHSDRTTIYVTYHNHDESKQYTEVLGFYFGNPNDDMTVKYMQQGPKATYQMK
jgi:hypothetical protein